MDLIGNPFGDQMNFESMVNALCGPEDQKHFIKIWMVFSVEGEKTVTFCHKYRHNYHKINLRSGSCLTILS